MLKEIKKNLVSLGLATSLAVSTMGCGETTYSDTELLITNSDVYKARDYFFVYIDGNVYCTTVKSCFNSNNRQKFLKYYDVKTEELIGIVVPDMRVQANNGEAVRGVCLDANFGDGEYRVGNLIPRQAVTPALSVVSNACLNQDEFNFVCSNSEEFKKYFLDACVFDDYECLDYLKGGEYSYQKDYSKMVDLTKYTCKLIDGTEQTFLGYRCSYDNTSIGYNYIYDILTGSIHYIGNLKEDSYVSVIEETYDNSALRSVSELQQEFALTSEKEVEDSIDLNDGTDLSNEEIEETLSSDSEEIVFSKDIYILDTTDENADYVALAGYVKDYYFLMNTFETNYDSFIYKDLNQVGKADISAKGISCVYTNELATEIVCTNYFPKDFDSNETNALKTLDEFLTTHDMADLLHENGEYKMSEILEIATYIDSLNNEKGLESQQEPSLSNEGTEKSQNEIGIEEDSEKIVYSKDIYILDTSDENAYYASVFENKKKYYVLLNTQQKNTIGYIYEDLNQVGKATINSEGNYCIYYNENETEVVETNYVDTLSNESNALKTLDEFLTTHDMADLIHENGEYKMSEILEIATYIDSLNNEKGLELTPDYE